MTSEEKLIITKLFELNISEFGTRSCLTMALKSARLHTGRNVQTGQYEYNLFNEFIVENDLFHSEYFTGLSIYLILLEQIGCIFKKKGYNKDHDKKNDIKIALENFCTLLNKQHIDIIIGLRHTLAHNFSLTSNIKKKKLNKPLYKFSLNFEENQIPITTNLEWKDKYNDKLDETITVIGIQKLCELIENVYSNLIYEFQNGNIELRIKDIDEIKARFTII